jgi:Putative adhesin
MTTRVWTMTKRAALAVAAVGTLGALIVCNVAAQDNGDKITVPFGDAAKPRTMIVKMMNGGITIRGYEGRDAIVESTTRSSSRSSKGIRQQPPGTEGMRRIDNNSGGLDITSDNNIVTIHGGMSRSTDVVIQVPSQTSLKLETLNGGAIVVENIAGEIDAQNMNGAVTINNVSGSVLANSMNGKVTVSLTKVTPNKTMSFSTMNGTIDVTLPADVKANLKMKTDNGDIWTDFPDIKLDGSHAPTIEDSRKNGTGRYHVKVDKSMYGTINGGGPEMQFVTYNGSIVIHKK